MGELAGLTDEARKAPVSSKAIELTYHPEVTGSPATSPKYAVLIRMTGLGDRLICLASAWLYARATKRTLVVDWRFSHLSPDARSNAFGFYFQNHGQLAGVPLIADDSVGELRWPRPRYPLIWNLDKLQPMPMLVPPMKADREAAVELIRNHRDRPEPVVVFAECINDGVVHFGDALECFQALHPVSAVAEAVAAFRRQCLADRRVIGLHMRHGNGGDIMGHTRFWASFDDAIGRCLRAITRARETLGRDAAVFLCTDSSEVEETMRTLLPDILTRPKQFRPVGEGELHLHPAAWLGAADTLTEMLLLSQTQALIRYPPGSFFSLYAAIMKPRTQPPPPTLYDLLPGFDPADPLSPALIL